MIQEHPHGPKSKSAAQDHIEVILDLVNLSVSVRARHSGREGTPLRIEVV